MGGLLLFCREDSTHNTRGKRTVYCCYYYYYHYYYYCYYYYCYYYYSYNDNASEHDY